MPTSSDHKIIITVDGYSACGKSTLARDLAKELNYIFIDSGAMYRAVTLYALNKQISFEKIKNYISDIKLSFKILNGISTIHLNGENVALSIRSNEVNQAVSHVAKIPEIRRFLVAQQRTFGIDKGIIMDGRDIGTVVFPDAELKFFVEADLGIRTKRRAAEMAEIGKTLAPKIIEQNLLDRDHIDSTREDSPLKKAKDAIAINNSSLTKAEQLKLCLQYANAYFAKVVL